MAIEPRRTTIRNRTLYEFSMPEGKDVPERFMAQYTEDEGDPGIEINTVREWVNDGRNNMILQPVRVQLWMSTQRANREGDTIATSAAIEAEIGARDVPISRRLDSR